MIDLSNYTIENDKIIKKEKKLRLGKKDKICLNWFRHVKAAHFSYYKDTEKRVAKLEKLGYLRVDWISRIATYLD
jgi:hypothetical protein